MLVELLPNIYIISKKNIKNQITNDILKYNIKYILKTEDDNINIDQEYSQINCINVKTNNTITNILNNNYKYYNDKIYECINKNKNIMLLLDENNIILSFIIIFIIYSTGISYIEAINCIKSKYKINSKLKDEQINFFNKILKI